MTDDLQHSLWENRLRRVCATSSAIEGGAIISIDGELMASVLPAHLPLDRLAAIAAAIASLGEKFASEVGRGTPGLAYIRSEVGTITICPPNEGIILVLVLKASSKLIIVCPDLMASGGTAPVAVPRGRSPKEDTGEAIAELKYRRKTIRSNRKRPGG